MSAHMKLKVWHGITHRAGGSHRGNFTVVAARTQREAAAALDITLHELRGYWSVTANRDDIQAALKTPGKPVIMGSA